MLDRPRWHPTSAKCSTPGQGWMRLPVIPQWSKFAPFHYHYSPRRYNNTRVAKHRKLSFWKIEMCTLIKSTSGFLGQDFTQLECIDLSKKTAVCWIRRNPVSGMQRWKTYYDCVVGGFKQRRLESAIAAISSCQEICVTMPNGDFPNDMFFSTLILNEKIGSCKVRRPKWSKKRLRPKRNLHQRGFL